MPKTKTRIQRIKDLKRKLNSGKVKNYSVISRKELGSARAQKALTDKKLVFKDKEGFFRMKEFDLHEDEVNSWFSMKAKKKTVAKNNTVAKRKYKSRGIVESATVTEHTFSDSSMALDSSEEFASLIEEIRNIKLVQHSEIVNFMQVRDILNRLCDKVDYLTLKIKEAHVV